MISILSRLLGSLFEADRREIIEHGVTTVRIAQRLDEVEHGGFSLVLGSEGMVREELALHAVKDYGSPCRAIKQKRASRFPIRLSTVVLR